MAISAASRAAIPPRNLQVSPTPPLNRTRTTLTAHARRPSLSAHRRRSARYGSLGSAPMPSSLLCSRSPKGTHNEARRPRAISCAQAPVLVRRPPAAGARQMEEGINLFLKERNNTLAGRKVEILFADTAGQPAQAKSKAQELVERSEEHTSE